MAEFGLPGVARRIGVKRGHSRLVMVDAERKTIGVNER